MRSGYWPLFRYHPGGGEHEHPFHLDSKAPSIPVSEFTSGEERFTRLMRTAPERTEGLLAVEQRDVDERWHLYEQIARIERHQVD